MATQRLHQLADALTLPSFRPAVERLPTRLAPGAATHQDLSRAIRLDVRAGRVWLTRPGDPDDHFIGAGESVLLSRGRGVVVQCDSPTAAWLAWTATPAAD